MRLLAFQGLRYTAQAGEAGRLAAPPYDQINEAARGRFHAVSPYQFTHLTRPVAPGAPGTEYQAAAALHARWLAEGIVAREAQPSLYPYVIQLAGGGRRLGVLGLAEYAPPSVIRPHEQTLDKPLADRTALLEAMRVDLEPALLLAEDDGRLEDLLTVELAGGAAPRVDYADDDGNHHLLFVIGDPARIRLYQQAVADRPAAIADGHHRYKVGQRFAETHGAAPGTAAGAKLAVVTSIRSPNLTIDPIHRALAAAIDPRRLAPLVAGTTPFAGTTGAELAAAVAAAPQPALGVWAAGGRPEILRLAAAGGSTDAGHPADAAAAPLAPLVVDLFQRAVLPALGLAPQAATDGTLVYRANPDELYAQVAGHELGTGFWLPPMQPAEFAAAVARGEMLPPKSTRFLPKAMSGLAWSDHESKVI